MNSTERRQARYERRKAKREIAKIKRNEGHDFQKVSEFGSLRKSFYKARRGTNWKASVQRYGCNVLRNSYQQSQKLKKHMDIRKGFIEFQLNERGKTRHITSVHISERVVQKSTCDYGIVPVMEKSLIYENGASQAGKGTEFDAQLLIKHLRRHYRKSGFKNSGYILLGDQHNFFGSMNHDWVNQTMDSMITDKELVERTMEFITPFKEGLGLGSQVCQINAVAYSNKIDHFIKDELRCEFHAKYMDDWYIITDTKEEAQRYLKLISEKYSEIGIEMNTKKTQIVKLSHGFTWLQDRYYLTESGKVIRKASHKSIVRARRKLKKLAKFYNDGIVQYDTIVSVYASFRGYMKRKNGHETKRSMEKLFNELFIKDFIGGKYNEQISFAE